MANKSEAYNQKIADKVRTQITGNAQKVATNVFGAVPAGMEGMTMPQFLNYVTRNWSDEAFRASTRINLGDEQFRNLVIKLWGGNEDVWPMPSDQSPVS